VLPGDDNWAVKDTVILRRDEKWHLWGCFHPLDARGQEDRMESRYATSSDGLNWTWHGTALRARPGLWDSRGARITAVTFADDKVYAFYDGRASAEENYDERTGLAVGDDMGHFAGIGSEPFGQSPDGKALRYLDILPLDSGHTRLYYELARPDGSHELRTELK
jgi:sucrose-6-phosphate hydrolase SacC (GH32 family)